jgi:hypothetical protein
MSQPRWISSAWRPSWAWSVPQVSRSVLKDALGTPALAAAGLNTRRATLEG